MTITIPPAALEAGVVAGLREAFRTVGATEAEIDALVAARMADTENFEMSVRQARAAFRAMLEAWPGMSQLAENDSASIREMAALILPLTENPDDKA